MKNRLILCLGLVFLTGCISIGNERLADDALVAKIKAGETTKDQVASLLGEPARKRSSISMGYTHEWWSYTYSSYMGNPWSYVLPYEFFVNGIGTPDVQRELDIFYGPDGTVTTRSLVTTSYELSGPYSWSKVASTAKVESLPSGLGTPVQFEDKVGYQDR
jgi:outer membrane protein assembly factor BamE (lipoprotein component of BamABCDE complex)